MRVSSPAYYRYFESTMRESRSKKFPCRASRVSIGIERKRRLSWREILFSPLGSLSAIYSTKSHPTTTNDGFSFLPGGTHTIFFFCSQGTFSLIVEAYHDANNSTHQSAGEHAVFLFSSSFFLFFLFSFFFRLLLRARSLARARARALS